MLVWISTYPKQTHARAFQLMSDKKVYAAFLEKHPELKGIVRKTMFRALKLWYIHRNIQE
jgi:hypothetical protein